MSKSMKTMKDARRRHSTRIEFWNDWIQISRDSYTGEIIYNQSMTELPGYNHRTIGMARDDREVFYIAAAVHRDNPGGPTPSRYSGRGLVAQRIKDVIRTKEVPMVVKMVTLVPLNYLSLLWEDSAVFSTLFGRVGEAACREAAAKLSRAKKPSHAR